MPWAASFVSTACEEKPAVMEEFIIGRPLSILHSKSAATFPGKILSGNTVMIATAEKTTDGDGGSGKVAEK